MQTNERENQNNAYKKPAAEKADGRTSSKMNPRRIAALLGVILLAVLYVVTLIVAIVDRSSSGKWFMICLMGTVTVPLLIWIYTWMYGMLSRHHTFASFDLGISENEEVSAADSLPEEGGLSETANSPDRQ